MPEVRHGAARRGGVPFFARAKKGTKETRPRRHALRAVRSGSASGPGIFVRHIRVPYENAVIHDGALRVLPDPLAVPHGAPKTSESNRVARTLLPLLLGPPEVRQSRRVKPRKGGAQGCASFSYRAGCPARSSRRDCAPAACGGRTAGVCFLCLLSLHKQRGASQQPNGRSSRASAASGAISTEHGKGGMSGSSSES